MADIPEAALSGWAIGRNLKTRQTGLTHLIINLFSLPSIFIKLRPLFKKWNLCIYL